MPKLILKLHDAVLKEIPLDQAQVTIGRKPDNDLVIDDPAVSSHHARLSQVQAVFFLEDLGSTNGTSVNEKRIDRRQLKADDRITIGKHTLIFRDDVQAVMPGAGSRIFDSERTMVLDAKTQREMLKRVEGGGVAEAAGPVGILQVLSGTADCKEYTLTGRLTTIGSAESSTVKLKGWFVPKTAAMIKRAAGGYSVSKAEGGKKVSVNGQPINGKASLQDGDVLEVGSVKLYFALKDSGQA